MSFWATLVGKKVAIALSGLILSAYVVIHLLGNLQVFAGPDRINAYARFLHERPILLWGARITLLTALVIHVANALMLRRLAVKARPIQYALYRPSGTSLGARTMLTSGVVVLGFVIFHILHLTTGTVHSTFEAADPYGNMMRGFRSLPATFIYSAGLVLLGFHVRHGLFAMVQSLGLSHPDYVRSWKRIVVVAVWIIVPAFISIPLAVLFGLLT